MIDPRALRKLQSVVRAGLRGVLATPLVFAATVATMAAGLLLLGGYLLVVGNMRAVLERAGEDLVLIAYLEPDLEWNAELAARRDALVALEGAAAVRFVGPAEALEQLRADLGPDAAVLDGLERNPLPAAFEISVAPGLREPQRVRALAERVGAAAHSGDVRWGEDWVSGYARIVRIAEWAGLGLGAFLALVLVAIVSSTVRLALHARADEIQIQRLVGAGGLFVRLPFCLEGAIQGAAAAGLALGVLWGFHALGMPLLGESLRYLLGPLELEFFGAFQVAALVLFAVALGIGGAFLSLLQLDESAS